MILPPLNYVRPRTVADAVDLLTHVDGATVLAGGQTLVNALKLDLVQPAVLVDVHRLDELRGVTVAADGTVTIGAATTYAAITASPEVRAASPWVAAMATGLVDRQVRNRGTIGGNVCLNDDEQLPAAAGRARRADPSDRARWRTGTRGRRVLRRHADHRAPTG
jgi:carbon-monoxide dehydrogenase medium subunit